MQPGQFLVNKYGTREKLIDTTDKAAAFEKDSGELVWYSKSKLLENGWSLLEEPWVPNYGCEYIYLSDLGTRKSQIFDGNTVDLFRLSVGNAFAPHKPRVEEKIELYKQKLIERMGRKD